MKVVILAGGLGTRISEESHLKPKPMIEIGGKPILWHIMKYYSSFGFNDFIICCGYKAYVIKEFFADYFLHTSDVTFDIQNNTMTVHENFSENWKVTCIDTGIGTMTGGRLARVKKYLNNEEFMLTYGDGVSNVDLTKLIDCHRTTGMDITLTIYQPGSRFGTVEVENNKVTNFHEKILEDGGWINGGFMICKPSVFDFIKLGDSSIFEKDVLESMVSNGKVGAYQHHGFWQSMDTLREKEYLEKIIENGSAPWMVWEND
ncbi:MAG: glucose-1-phosphate cytidylyltransferase [Erysipelotrichales bacterium]|nr:glucose-1-phosphate cytidylyltransferase [Erysipelotrichales bacterium]